MKIKRKYLNKDNIKYVLKTNVLEEARKRVSFLFDEFDQIMVAISGGKDSTIVFELVYEEAKRRGRLPIKALFIDQEAEWLAAIDMVRDCMTREGVIPVWVQCPFKLFNATSFHDHWLQCWDPDKPEKWIRPKESYSKQENIYGTDRFTDMFTKVADAEFGGKKGALVGGMRCEESPIRAKTLTRAAKYKWVTWGKVLSSKNEQYTFYPIYDWSYTDVWKAIHDNDWKYCKIYDYMFQHGVTINNMRVSNLHHETAVRALFILQEIEPENYNKIVERVDGIDMAGKFQENFFCPKELPAMFRSWREYRDYLVETVLDPQWKERFTNKFITMDELYETFISNDRLAQMQIQSILTNDWEFLKMRNPQVPRERYNEFKQHRKDVSAKRKAGGATRNFHDKRDQAGTSRTE